MKVLHVNYSNGEGGAAIAASRIHRALIQQGIESTFLCCRASHDLPESLVVCSKLGLFINRCRNWFIRHLLRVLSPNCSSINIFPSGLYKFINSLDVDIVNLHWVNGEMLSIEEIGKIKKPIVWTMHDFWPCLGANGYMHSNKVTMVENSPISYLSSKWMSDIDVWCWKRKKAAWAHLNIFPVGVSDWEVSLIKQSILFRNTEICKIHNCLDITIFKPLSINAVREKLHLPKDKRIILVGGSDNKIYRKGFDILLNALMKIEKRENLEIALFGEKMDIEQITGFKTYLLGRIKGDNILAEIYNAADIMCIPARQETFGQTAAEAMACGIPVVAFRTTGLIDIIDHKKNGYLAERFDPIDFAKGIEWILALKKCETLPNSDYTLESNSNINYNDLCINARQKIIEMFSMNKIADQYIQLYRKILNNDVNEKGCM